MEQLRDQIVGDDDGIEAEAADFVIARYRRRLDDRSANEDEIGRMKLVNRAERRLFLAALRAERDEYYRHRLAHEIDDPLHRRLVRQTDLMEASLSSFS